MGHLNVCPRLVACVMCAAFLGCGGMASPYDHGGDAAVVQDGGHDGEADAPFGATVDLGEPRMLWTGQPGVADEHFGDLALSPLGDGFAMLWSVGTPSIMAAEVDAQGDLTREPVHVALERAWLVWDVTLAAPRGAEQTYGIVMGAGQMGVEHMHAFTWRAQDALLPEIAVEADIGGVGDDEYPDAQLLASAGLGVDVLFWSGRELGLMSLIDGNGAIRPGEATPIAAPVMPLLASGEVVLLAWCADEQTVVAGYERIGPAYSEIWSRSDVAPAGACPHDLAVGDDAGLLVTSQTDGSNGRTTAAYVLDARTGQDVESPVELYRQPPPESSVPTHPVPALFLCAPFAGGFVLGWYEGSEIVLVTLSETGGLGAISTFDRPLASHLVGALDRNTGRGMLGWHNGDWPLVLGGEVRIFVQSLSIHQ